VTASPFDARRLHDAVCRASEGFEAVSAVAGRRRVRALEAMRMIGMPGVGAVFTISTDSEALTSPATLAWFVAHEADLRDGDWPRRVASTTPLAVGRLVASLVSRWVDMLVEEDHGVAVLALASAASGFESASRYVAGSHRADAAVTTFTFGDAAWLQCLQGLAEAQVAGAAASASANASSGR
jgi:hypothetical protein